MNRFLILLFPVPLRNKNLFVRGSRKGNWQRNWSSQKSIFLHKIPLFCGE